MTPDSVLITVYRAERVKAATRTPATWVLYRLVLCWPRRASLLGLLAALASIFFSFRRWASPMLSRYLCANQPATAKVVAGGKARVFTPPIPRPCLLVP